VLQARAGFHPCFRLAALAPPCLSTVVRRTRMPSPQPVQLSRRGQLLRAVSHAIRCLNQVSRSDMESWRRDTRRFRKTIRSQYSDALEHIPAAFDSWTAKGETGVRDEQDDKTMIELLEKLSHEIRREACP
jgi:hypothetical protein